MEQPPPSAAQPGIKSHPAVQGAWRCPSLPPLAPALRDARASPEHCVFSEHCSRRRKGAAGGAGALAGAAGRVSAAAGFACYGNTSSPPGPRTMQGQRQPAPGRPAASPRFPGGSRRSGRSRHAGHAAPQGRPPAAGGCRSNQPAATGCAPPVHPPKRAHCCGAGWCPAPGHCRLRTCHFPWQAAGAGRCRLPSHTHLPAPGWQYARNG